MKSSATLKGERSLVKILVAVVGRREHLGDNVMKSCVLEPLRLNFPSAHISVCAKYSKVFFHNPHIDAVIDGSGIHSIDDAKRVLSSSTFDLVFDMSTYPDFYFERAAAMMTGKRILGVYQ